MRRTSSIVVLLGAIAVSVAGCALLPVASAPSAQPTSTAGAEPTATATPPLSPGAIALDLDCTTLVSDEVIYEWGSGNWAADPDFSAIAGSSAATITELGGTACGWVNLTSGEKLTVAIGEFSAERLAELRAERAANAQAVSDFGVDGFFAVSGQADAFSEPYWVSASSSWFGASTDAEVIVQAALDATS